MKKILISCLLLFLLIHPAVMKAQVQNVIVETYYISDANDATDTINGSARILPAGSKTYRVFIQLENGCKLKKIYGDANHALKIMSTDTFYNNIDRPGAYFGYLVNKVWFSDNPTLALDSWLTLGRGAKNYSAVLKNDDTNGSFIGGSNNYGGTAAIPGGLLVNTDANAGIPITTSDGLMPDTAVISQWLDNGFRDAANVDTTVFGSVNSGMQFISNVAELQQNSGVSGFQGSNKVLVAQLTTRGNISFELNVVVTDQNGNDIRYVADGSTLLPGEQISPFLKYPAVCGCTDPHYLEYSPAFACENTDSCRTRIVYGCMDPAACNYDADANFNIAELCCYPGLCNDRDIATVCPQLANDVFRLYPNPAQSELTISFSNRKDEEIRYEIYNSFGRKISERNINSTAENFTIDISAIPVGVYMFLLYRGESSESITFLKE